MTFALDGSPLATAPGGIARYTTELHRALATLHPEHRFELLPGARRLWWSYQLPLTLRRQRIALFHGTDFAVPYVPVCPSVMTLHDLSPWKKEFEPATSNRVRRRTPWLLRMKLPTRIVTPTEAIRREAIDHFRLEPDVVRAVPLGVGVQPGRVHRTDMALIVGAGARKNVALAEEIVPENIALKIVDANVDDAELTRLYCAARVLLIPSLYEGFGLPALEAMACGTPVLASQDPALIEVCGGAALHLDVRSPAAWREALKAVLTQTELWNRLSAAGLARARSFSWERTARETFAVYEEAMRAYAR